jgi:phosphoglycolate phosphatase-like HAD superfamily hydrolase
VGQPFTKPGIVFFDLDGPLLDVSGRYVALHQEILSELGLRGLPGPTYWQRKRARCPEEAILAEVGATACAHAYVRCRLALIETPEYLAHDRTWPWTHNTLALLSAARPLVLVTARANRPLLLEQLDKLRLAPFFHEVLSTPAGKRVDEQKAALIRDYLARHGHVRGNHWMVGDTEADVGAGRLTGLRTAAVLSGIRDREFLIRAEPDCLLNDIRELTSLWGLEGRPEDQPFAAALPTPSEARRSP